MVDPEPGNAAAPAAIRDNMVKTRIAPDLLNTLNPDPSKARVPTLAAAADAPVPRFAVIMEMNALFPGGPGLARAVLLKQFMRERKAAGVGPADAARVRQATAGRSIPPLPPSAQPLFDAADQVAIHNSLFTTTYLFADVTRETINRLAAIRVTLKGKPYAPIYKIWADHEVRRFVYASIRTVKCDAARAAFSAAGRDVVWAVADTGIDRTHPHFQTHKTLDDLPSGLSHRDFTQTYASDEAAADAALVDGDGHGTHVAGIIAGETRPVEDGKTRKLMIHRTVRVSDDDVRQQDDKFEETISGMAPFCKLLSLKVLQKGSKGSLSAVLAAIGYVQALNDNGRLIKVHGINLSLGYTFEPEWFAAGQSPLCNDVDRLVRSGVAVVVAAGNAGYGTVISSQGSAEAASHGGTIADPGNADLAITVGSTHRDAPHAYGISYFSAKGPTADGRMKPDIVAPGERIVSCARMSEASEPGAIPFKEDSGTSMAAPHVSGAAAAFLSVRGEFKGRPEQLKAVLIAGAIDLKRRPEYQGAGLVDVMRALQSV